MPVITIIGYTENGREVRIEVDSHGDANRDISDIAGIDRMLAANGILPTRPVAGEGEQKQVIQYILRRKHKNKDGSYIPVMDLYGNKYRWVSFYLDDKQRGTEFHQATGLDPNKMPLSTSPQKEIDLDDPDIMSLFVRLNPPVEIIWKPNPKWNPDLSEEDKKKIPKRYFVRWSSVAPSSVQTSSSAPSVLSVSAQTTPRQTAQTTPPASAPSASVQTDSRQTPQTTQTGHTPPQTPVQPPRRMAMQEFDSRDETVTGITVSVANNGSVYYVTPDKAYTFTRDLFRKAGYACDHWETSAQGQPPNVYALNPAAHIISQKQESGHWKIMEVTKMIAGKPVENGQSEYVGEPAPDFEPDEVF